MSDPQEGSVSVRPPRSLRWRVVVLVLVVVAIGCGVALRARSGSSGTSAPEVVAPSAQGVAGYLFQDLDRDGAHGGAERVLPRWRVRVYSTGPLPLAETVTDGRGAFRVATVAPLAPGTTSVQVRFQPVMEGPAADDLPEPSALSQSVTMRLGDVDAIAVASYRKCLDADGCAGLEPPDLVPQLTSTGGDEYPPPTETEVDTQTEPGRVLLRFATSTANLGGLLHVTGLPAGAGDDDQRIQQRVYGTDGVLVRDAGAFVYHPEHRHFHVEEFERYELLAADKRTVVRSSEKVSFCLTDVLPVDPPEREDGDLFLDLPPLECGASEQGMNTGFADYYGAALPDQWIDVTGVPSGEYWIRLTVDPERRLLESDRTNNTAIFPVTYTAP